MGQTRYVEEMVEEDDEDGEDTEIELVVQVIFTLVQTSLTNLGFRHVKELTMTQLYPSFMPVCPVLINPAPHFHANERLSFKPLA